MGNVREQHHEAERKPPFCRIFKRRARAGLFGAFREPPFLLAAALVTLLLGEVIPALALLRRCCPLPSLIVDDLVEFVGAPRRLSDVVGVDERPLTFNTSADVNRRRCLVLLTVSVG